MAGAVISAATSHLRPSSFAVAGATVTAGAFAAMAIKINMAINAPNREAEARTTVASRS
jgi:hypothetical protein